ncbi:MAG TPA: hypothetical protein VKS78_00115 [Roseiarcus sp.]|nr:hypothetical protein [Roseiarcus sp.]
MLSALWPAFAAGILNFTLLSLTASTLAALALAVATIEKRSFLAPHERWSNLER